MKKKKELKRENVPKFGPGPGCQAARLPGCQAAKLPGSSALLGHMAPLLL